MTPALPGDDAPEGSPPLTGTIANRYRIDGRIGEGGMAVVYRAHDLTRGVDVALKAPKAELVSQLGPARFAREVQISTQLQHPHIVPVLDSGVHENMPFYVMPLIEGESLEQRMRRSGPLAIQDAIGIINEILDGLAYAHALGFVHRDVKPANVMLTRGHAQLADFGIARAVEHTDNKRLTESGFALGTAEYMSPEQATGDKNLDGRSDIYSVGCVLYEMLVGSPPFTGSTSRAVMARHFVDPVPAIRTVRETVPEPLESVVFTAMAKTPADRFPTAEAFLDALRDPAVRAVLVNPPHRTSAARAIAPTQLVPAPTGSRRLLIGGAIVVAAAIGVFAWRSKAPTVAALDPNRVMVFPFEQSAELASRETLGEDVATIIGNALDAAEPLRWVDGWASLDSAQRSGNRRSISDETARALARSKRCAFVVRGRLTKISDAIEVSLTLYDVAGDSVVSRGVARGTIDDPWKQGLNAVNRVLPRLITGPSRNLLVDWEGRPPSAVASFLVGEARFRRLQIAPALDAYRNAVALDSTFATAALRGAQAASWAHSASIGSELLRIALAQRLPDRSRFFALGVQAYQAGAADSAIALLTRATTIDPENFAAWAQLGEVYTHLLPLALAQSPDQLADDAFARARALDSTAISVLLHPIQIRLRRGDLAGAEPMLARFRSARLDALDARAVEMASACVRSQVDADTLRAALPRDPLAFLTAAQQLGGAGAQLACTQPMYELTQVLDTAATDSADARRYVALVGLVALAINANDSTRAHHDVDAFERRWPPVPGLLLTASSWSPFFRGRASAVARRDSSTYGAGLQTAPETNTIFRSALHHLASGDIARATLIQTTLQAHAARPDSGALQWYADAVQGQLLLARGDTTAAEGLLRRVLQWPIVADELQWDITNSRGTQRLMLARLLMARGKAREAWHVANVFDSPASLVSLVFLPASLELRAAAARQVGDVAAERQYLARLAAIRRAR